MTDQGFKQQSEQILELMQLAVAKAIEEHRRAGRSIVVSRDGQIVEIPPEDIPPLEEKFQVVNKEKP